MGRKRKKDYESLGAEYIHSNWDNFTDSVYSTDGEKYFLKALEVSGDALARFLRKELEFYKKAENRYQVLVKRTYRRYKGQELTRDQILENFRRVYQQSQNGEHKEFAILHKGKEAIQKMTDHAPWMKDSKVLERRFQDESRGDLGQQVLEGIKALGELTQLYNKSSIIHAIPGNSPDGSEVTDAMKRIKKFISSDQANKLTKRWEKLFDNYKKNPGNNSQQIIDFIQTIRNTISDMMIHQYGGNVAEHLTEDITYSKLKYLYSALSKEQKTDAQGKFKEFNIIDRALAEVTVNEDTPVLIGLTQKFWKTDEFTAEYSNLDFVSSVEQIADSKLLNVDETIINQLHNSLEKIQYIRANFRALSSFALDKNYYDQGKAQKLYNSFRNQEFALMARRGITRVLNGYLNMMENGLLGPFDKTDKQKMKDPIIFNAFMVVRNNVYWTYDIMKHLFNTYIEGGGLLDSRKVAKKDARSIGSRSSGFYATMSEMDFTFGEDQEVSPSASTIWNEKRKYIRGLKEQISYSLLYKNRSSNMNTLSGNLNRPFTSKIRYTLNPSKIKI